MAKPQRDKAFMATISRQTAIEWIELQREMFSKYLTSLKRLRNTRLPVGRLPPELIIEVFVHTERISEQDMALPLGHVCYQWRLVASSISELWRRIQLENLPLSRISLARCVVGPIYASFINLHADDAVAIALDDEEESETIEHSEMYFVVFVVPFLRSRRST